MKLIIRLCVGLFIMVTFCCPLAFAESKVVTCEGKYVMGDLDTKKDARALALMEAKRSSLEQAGTYLESSSEVQNYELTKDEINSLTSGVVSVEVLKEEWKMSGENLMVTVLIRANVDTSNLKERISALKDDKESVDDLKDIQTQLAALQQDLQQLKAERTEEISEKQGDPTKKELKKKYVAIINKMSALDNLKSAKADLANGRLEEALSGFNEAVSINPEMAEAYAGQAMALSQMGRLDEAIKKIDTALDIAPDSGRAHAVKSLILAKSNRYAQALMSINKAIELNPQNPRFYFSRGGIYLKLQRPLPAFKNFDRACRMGHRKACDRTKALAQRLKIRQRLHQESVPPKRPRQPRPGH